MKPRKTERPFDRPARHGAPHSLRTHGRTGRTRGRGRPRRSAPREGPSDRLDRILAAATDLFAREGYHKATMRRLARARPRGPGVGLAGLYHYVDSKQRLLFLIQFRAFSRLLTEVTAAISGVDDPVEQLRRLIHTHVHFVAGDMATLKVCSHELDSLTGEAYEEVRRVRRRYYDLARSIVSRIIEQAAARDPASQLPSGCGPIDPRVDLSSRGGLDERLATMSLFGTLNWIYRWYDPTQGRSPASLAQQIFAQFLAGLLGTAGGGHAASSPPSSRRVRSRSNGRASQPDAPAHAGASRGD